MSTFKYINRDNKVIFFTELPGNKIMEIHPTEPMPNLRIKLLCECCGVVHELPRTDEIPPEVNSLACNFCCECEDKMNDYYNEWYIDESELPIVENPNQIQLF